MNDDVYIFFHLSKTAGTSLREMLFRLVETQEKSFDLVYPYYFPNNYPLIPDEKSNLSPYSLM
jgi:hypothetical protein